MSHIVELQHQQETRICFPCIIIGHESQSTTESFNRLGADSLLDSSTNGMRPFGSFQELTFNYFLVAVFNLPLTPLTDESSAMALYLVPGYQVHPPQLLARSNLLALRKVTKHSTLEKRKMLGQHFIHSVDC